jgi:hypothetical protein
MLPSHVAAIGQMGSPDHDGVVRLLGREAVGECALGRNAGRRRGEKMATGGEKRGHRQTVVAYQVVLAIQWLCSLSRLWVAVTSRHSDCAADLPLRMNRSMCRLYLICPNTGSIVIFRCA